MNTKHLHWFTFRFNLGDNAIPRSNFDSFWRALITVFQVGKSVVVAQVYTFLVAVEVLELDHFQKMF